MLPTTTEIHFWLSHDLIVSSYGDVGRIFVVKQKRNKIECDDLVDSEFLLANKDEQPAATRS